MDNGQEPQCEEQATSFVGGAVMGHGDRTLSEAFGAGAYSRAVRYNAVLIGLRAAMAMGREVALERDSSMFDAALHALAEGILRRIVTCLAEEERHVMAMRQSAVNTPPVPDPAPKARKPRTRKALGKGITPPAPPEVEEGPRGVDMSAEPACPRLRINMDDATCATYRKKKGMMCPENCPRQVA